MAFRKEEVGWEGFPLSAREGKENRKK